VTAVPQPGLLLTLDYPGYQERSRISDLVASFPGVDVWHLMVDPPPDASSAIEYARALLHGLAPDRRVDAVLAYCLASPIAHEVARLTTRLGQPPPVLVALDGAPCLPATVAHEYRQVVSRFGGTEAVPAVEPTPQALAEAPGALLAAMASELAEHAVRGVSDVDGEVDDVALHLVRELVDKATSWLTHVVAAHNAPFSPWPGQTLLVCSRNHPFRGPWPNVSASRTLSIDCGRGELLRHPEARAAVADALRRPA
jgi:hypothetical protein